MSWRVVLGAVGGVRFRVHAQVRVLGCVRRRVAVAVVAQAAQVPAVQDLVRAVLRWEGQGGGGTRAGVVGDAEGARG